MRSNFPIVALGIFAIVALFVGCVALQPGADPLVVRVEQGEMLAKSSFDFVVTTDDSNRGFWMTNAPALHNFAEWLREPVPIGTNQFARGIAMILQVNAAKITYQSDKSSSNALLSVFSTLSDAQQQASAWQTIATKK
jgi:hypothetical protein